jgi:hypothetical protein
MHKDYRSPPRLPVQEQAYELGEPRGEYKHVAMVGRLYIYQSTLIAIVSLDCRVGKRVWALMYPQLYTADLRDR